MFSNALFPFQPFIVPDFIRIKEQGRHRRAKEDKPMAKQKYENPEITPLDLPENDIITASGDGRDSEGELVTP